MKTQLFNPIRIIPLLQQHCIIRSVSRPQRVHASHLRAPPTRYSTLWVLLGCITALTALDSKRLSFVNLNC